MSAPAPSPTIPPIPELPPPVYPPMPPPDLELTLDEELELVLRLIDGLLLADWLTVDQAVALLVELAEAPELDDDQRALVEANLRLLWDYQDRPETDQPRLLLRVEPSTDTTSQTWGLPATPEEEPLTPSDCDVTLDVLEDHRKAACD